MSTVWNPREALVAETAGVSCLNARKTTGSEVNALPASRDRTDAPLLRERAQRVSSRAAEGS